MMLRYLFSFSLWLGPILCFYTTYLRQLTYFFSLTGAMVGHSSALLLFHHCLQFGLELELSDQVTAGTAPAHCPVWGRGGCHSICRRMIDTSQTLSLALIGCVDPGEMDSCKSNYSQAEPQTADLYLYSIVRSGFLQIQQKHIYRLHLKHAA